LTDAYLFLVEFHRFYQKVYIERLTKSPEPTTRKYHALFQEVLAEF